MSTSSDELLRQARDLARAGQLQLAEVLGRQAVAAGSRGQAQAFLGALAAHQGRNEEALLSLDQALALQPEAADSHHARGLVLKKLGRLGEAVAAYDSALALAPGHAEAHHNRGTALRHQGLVSEAVAAHERAVQLRPRSPEIRNGLGMALHAAGRYEDAVSQYDDALQMRPGDSQIQNNRGMALHAQGRFEEAAAAYEQALRAGPSCETLMNLGVTRWKQRRHALALQHLDAALALDPDDTSAQLNRANVLADLDRPDEALAVYRRLIAAQPGDVDAILNTANVLRDTGRHEDSVAHYNRALQLAPDNADVHWNLSLCLLTMGDYARGWQEYEWRWKARELGQAKATVDAPIWLGGEPLAGKTLLLQAEQGLGDTLQLCRYAAPLEALGAKVVLEVQEPLLHALAGLPGVHRLIAQGEPAGAVDFRIPLFSLPLALGTRLDTIPASAGYLVADAARADRWGRLMGNERPQVGLAWAGNPGHANDRRRSLDLRQLLAALPDGIRYWCLHKDVTPAESALLQADGRVGVFEDNDFASKMAQISRMDAVVSVDTSVAHLSAALGKPTWILVARPADFRWLADRADSPWYASVRLFRQETAGDWSKPLAGVAEALAGLS